MRDFLIDTASVPGSAIVTIWCDGGINFTARCTDMDMLVAFAHQLLAAVEEVNQ